MASQFSVEEKNNIFENLLRTEAGQKNLGKAICQNISLDNLARKFLKQNEVINEYAEYVKETTSLISVLDQYSNWKFNIGSKIIVPIFEIGSNQSVNVNRHFIIQNRLTEINKFIEKICHNFNDYEEKLFVNALRTINENYDFRYVKNIFDIEFQKYSIILSLENGIWLKMQIKGNVMLNKYCPLEIITSKHCKNNEIFIIPNKTELGAMPIKGNTQCNVSNNPLTLETNFYISEHIGMTILNPELIIKFVIDKKLKLDDHNKKYAFVSGGSENIERIKKDEENRDVIAENRINRGLKVQLKI